MTRTLDRGDEGFTLSELLVVIIVIAVLAAIAIPLYLNQQKSAYDAATRVDMRELGMQLLAADIARAEAGTYMTWNSWESLGEKNGMTIYAYLEHENKLDADAKTNATVRVILSPGTVTNHGWVRGTTANWCYWMFNSRGHDKTYYQFSRDGGFAEGRCGAG